ncbi:transient receptor potential cation channel subfamily A member 1 [Macrotis lagotis]|uniref:transient receptor potential cation channel subfamily A member 1 n=1 Tax=Macrotis lagotis TaxID=92651 RepID=UPI003D690140
MKRKVKKVVQQATTENVEAQGVAYEGVEDQMDASEEDVFKVIVKGNVKRLQSFIMKNRDGLYKYDELNATPLHHAAAQDQIELLEMIINDSSFEEVNILDILGNTPLHWATEKNQIENVKFLLSRGADPNIRNNNLMAPLHLAIQYFYNEIVKILIEHNGTDVNLIGENGNTPLMLACSKDNSEALKFLVDNGAKICKTNKFGCFPVHLAAFSGSKKCIEMLLKFGEGQGYSREYQINFLNNRNSSPLHYAVQSGDLEMIKLCLLNGAQIELVENGKCTALHFAATQGATEIVKLMISSYSGRDDIINIVDGNNETLLHRVSLFDHHELAEYLISMGANINSIDCEGRSPLLLATSSASWNIVNLLLSKGANVEIKDHLGRNFLHLTVLQPYGLKKLKQEFLQMQHIKNLVMDEDIDGCTPLHYACSQGVSLSVNNLLCLNVSISTKSKNNRSPLHFAANFGRINTCQRLVRDMTDTRLLNEGDQNGMTPLHLAAKNGHDKVVKFLLKKGALFLSDYNGWTALHHASMGGYTQTMKIILNTNVKCTDHIDEEGNTALHYAAREGHAKAVALLLDYDAEIVMNKQSASFLHEAIHNRRKEVVITAIRSKRWDDCLVVFSPLSLTNKYPIMEMIEYLPESMKTLLDVCSMESLEERSCPNFHIDYNFKYLQSPLEFRKNEEYNSTLYGPLTALNAMVQHNRRDLLDHPVCREYLIMKWMAYGFKAHIMNLGLYCLGLIPMTILISNIESVTAFNSTGDISDMDHRSEPSNTKNSYLIEVCMMLVFLSSVFGFCKEIIQIFQQRMNYFLDQANLIEWIIYTTSIIFVSPLFISIPHDIQWQCGAISVFFFWMNFLLYLQRFENYGIYVVMLLEITKTLLKTTFVFFFLILAFGLGFHVLLSIQNAYKTPMLSIMQTFTMMLGDINYHESFLEPLRGSYLPYPILSYLFLIVFILYIPIVLMNLLIGLAVGDIAEVQKNASMKRIAMQVKLHTSLEKKLPVWFLTKVDQESITVYPNRRRFGFMNLFQYCFCTQYTKPETQNADNTLEVEVMKQKYRLKDLALLLEKQHELVKLIIQKMEIISEAEDEDSSFSFQQRFRNQQLEKTSKWHTVLNVVKAKK